MIRSEFRSGDRRRVNVNVQPYRMKYNHGSSALALASPGVILLDQTSSMKPKLVDISEVTLSRASSDVGRDGQHALSKCPAASQPCSEPTRRVYIAL